MPKEQVIAEERAAKKRRIESEVSAKQHANSPAPESSGLAALQHLVGNRALQRMLAQRSAEGAFELDDDTAEQINRERGSGQPLDENVNKQVSGAIGRDFSSVRVHTSPQADMLNRQLSAKAFTTGHDIFFREGAYQPQTSGGQELIAHELSHVVQQSSGRADAGNGGMMVGAPDDAFEQEAALVAKAAVGHSSPEVQRQGNKSSAIQAQDMEEDETVQTQELDEEEEEAVQTQELDEEKEETV